MSPVNVKGRRKVINFYLYPICISNQQILLQLCVELQSELAQAVAPLPTGFSAADACTFFLSKTTQNVPKSLPLLPLCFGSAVVVKPMEGMASVVAPHPKSSNLTSPPPLVAAVVVVVIVVVVFVAVVVVIVVVVVVAAVVAGYNV